MPTEAKKVLQPMSVIEEFSISATDVVSGRLALRARPGLLPWTWN